MFINGKWYGFVANSMECLHKLKEARRKGYIHIHVSFSIDFRTNEIHIYSDRGRCVRPLIVMKDNKLLYSNVVQQKLREKKYSWLHLTNGSLCDDPDHACIEYLDINETNNCVIATTTKDATKEKNSMNYSHCEIDPSTILGVLTSGIPFAHHNQAPRNTYQSAMGKQAIGVHATNFNDRFDTFSNVLYYPQKPMINTRLMSYMNIDKLPNGQNVIVAIASHGGYNQEDSILFNQSSIDRGMFQSVFYRCYRSEEQKNQLTGEEDKFCKPDLRNVLFPKPCNYDKLEDNGFVKENTFVDENDIIIGKIMPINDDEYDYRDCSVNIKSNESGYIDKYHIDTNGDGYKCCKVRVRKTKKPMIGDKFSSRHGQKGTIGMTYLEEDMPFTKDGIRPDIIINPHAIPSRMTIAQLIECIMGKACCLSGHVGDGNVFNEDTVEDIANTLQAFNYEKHGNEILYNGKSGEQMKTKIFIGPTYYQRLKHMSADKIHSRSSGPVVTMTRQPAEGRAAHGGLRFGEMERDCMIAHGSSSFLKERLFEVSDKFNCFVCESCGLTAVANPRTNMYECKRCNNYSDVSKVSLPYSCKLLFQELQTMSLAPRIITE